MTPPTQDDLAAGRELDARVAEAIGWTFAHTEDEYDPRTPGSLTLVGVTPDKRRLSVVPAYSTDITAAWQIIPQLNRPIRIDYTRSIDGRMRWYVSIDEEHFADADTAPLAICRAALKAVSA